MDKKETTSYKIGRIAGQAMVVCVVACLIAICIAATVNIITKLI